MANYPKTTLTLHPSPTGWKSANLERPEVINLNVNREPRFYAWINFDGCDVGPYLVAGKPLRLDLRSYEACGYSPDYAGRPSANGLPEQQVHRPC